MASPAHLTATKAGVNGVYAMQTIETPGVPTRLFELPSTMRFLRVNAKCRLPLLVPSCKRQADRSRGKHAGARRPWP
jgi:hypothetical protein